MRTKIGLTFGMLTLILLIGTGAAVNRLVSQRIEAETSAALLRAARLVAFTFTRELQERQRDLETLALLVDSQGSSAGSSGDPAHRADRVLAEFTRRYGFDGAWLADDSGTVRATSDPASAIRDLSTHPWFKPALAAPQIDDHDLAPEAGATPRPAVVLAVPAPANGTAGVLVAELATPWIDRLRDRLRMLVPPAQFDGLEVLVLSGDGRLVAGHNAPSVVPEEEARMLPAGACTHTGAKGSTPGHVSCAVVSEPHRDAAGLDWRVVIRLPERLAFATADNIEASIAWIGLLAATLFGVVGWLLADRISEPIKAISQAADRIASGDRQVALPITGRNEIAVLARSLSSLVHRLRQDEATLLRANQELEARVAERTLELEKAVAELQDANTDLDRFASMVSHDLLAPVRAMRTFSELLIMDYNEVLPPEAQRLLKRVDQAGLDMSNLVNALHALSKLGKKPLHVTQTDMTEVVRQCVQAHLPAWNEQAIHIQSLEPALCDPTMIRIVFDNLIGNAVKYSQRAAQPCIVIGGERQDDMQIYWVSDNGAGFDPQYTHRLFQIFQRLHSARDYPGTGVGLATVAKIVTRHGGRVWAKGMPHEGATFYFSLPIRRRDEKPGDVWPESTLELPPATPASA